MKNSDYNAVSLAKDPMLYFDRENPLKYTEYDFHVLAHIVMKYLMRLSYLN